MKKYLTIGVWLTAVILLTSCKKNVGPGVCISPSTLDSVYVGQAITFSTCTNGEKLYVWDFGDGTTDSMQYSWMTVSHSYSAVGTYTASLTIYTTQGQSNKKSMTIHVVSGGTWTFDGVAHQASYYAYPFVYGVNSTLLYHNYNTTTKDSADMIFFSFYDTTQVLPDGAYTIVSNQYLTYYQNSPSVVQAMAGKVTVEVDHNSIPYSPTTGLTPGGQTVNISNSNGQIHITASGFSVANAGLSTRDSIQNINLTQFAFPYY